MQMKMFLTRLGVNSKAIITGNITQIDLPMKTDSGLIIDIEIQTPGSMALKKINKLYSTK